MIEQPRIKIYTRSMNRVLYHKAMSLCPLPYPRVRLQGTSADGYLYQLIADDEADWVVNIDEDAFISNPVALQQLIDYCIVHGYENCGMPDGGVVHLRDGNPLVTNPYFNILHTNSIRQKLNSNIPVSIEAPNLQRFDADNLLVASYNFDNTNEEAYYPLFIWMSNHCKTLYLNATNHPDGESTVLCDHLGKPFLTHTWYSRFYNYDRAHTRRIDKAFHEACHLQGTTYHQTLPDTLSSIAARTANTITTWAVRIKHTLRQQ